MIGEGRKDRAAGKESGSWDENDAAMIETNVDQKTSIVTGQSVIQDAHERFGSNLSHECMTLVDWIGQ